MNFVNSTALALFNVLTIPLEWVGAEFSIVIVSGIFGILALIAFKHISYQKGIKSTKDRIKGHLIEIRIYQDDLVVVAKSVCKILLRNFQYLGFNFGPFLPLAAPFVLVAAQLVVRYGFDPLPVHQPTGEFLPGQGVMLEIQMAEGREAEIGELEIDLPDGLRAMSPVVRNRQDGRAFVEVVAVQDGEWDVGMNTKGGETLVKKIYAGEVEPRSLQPERVASFWAAWLWPAEDTLTESSGIERVHFLYPERELAWMPDGPLGVLIGLLVASMAFGFALLKPLGIQI